MKRFFRIAGEKRLTKTYTFQFANDFHHVNVDNCLRKHNGKRKKMHKYGRKERNSPWEKQKAMSERRKCWLPGSPFPVMISKALIYCVLTIQGNRVWTRVHFID